LRSKWKLINLHVGRKNGQEKTNNNLVLAMQPQLIILEVIFHTRRRLKVEEVCPMDLALFITKAYMPIFVVENPWPR
jgi:hypothetical protein